MVCFTSHQLRYTWMDFSKVFNHLTSFNINHLTSFNINVGWYVHMLFLLVMNRFLVIGMIRHSARRRPGKRTMPRQRWTRAGEKFKPNSLGFQPKLGSHTYIYTLFTYITLHYITLRYITLHYIPLHTITYHYIPLHTITYHYIPLHTITYHYIPLHTITYHYIPLHTITYHYIPLHTITLHTYINI